MVLSGNVKSTFSSSFLFLRISLRRTEGPQWDGDQNTRDQPVATVKSKALDEMKIWLHGTTEYIIFIEILSATV